MMRQCMWAVRPIEIDRSNQGNRAIKIDRSEKLRPIEIDCMVRSIHSQVDTTTTALRRWAQQSPWPP